MSTQPSTPKDMWASGLAYEPFVGRWSRLVAPRFLAWLGLPPHARWLDVGCGTGALTHTILQTADPESVHGVEPAAGFLAVARQQIQDPRVRFDPGNALALPVPDAAYDAVVAGLVLNFVPDRARGLAEMVRAVRPGGTVATYVWDYGGKMQFMRHYWNAVTALAPEDAHHDEGRRFPFCQPGPLADLWRSAGLRDVETTPIDIDTHFTSFDDFWLPFLGGQGPAAAYAMALSDERRAALRERLRAALPFALDGSIPLVARAWAVRGHK
jgi:SAM-dependent methyltransferase